LADEAQVLELRVQEVGGRVFCGAAGELFCLDRATGHQLWHNKLKGLGTGLVSFAASDAAAAAGVITQQAAAAVTAANV
jgi:outer membrane protein assembly factor BamB